MSLENSSWAKPNLKKIMAGMIALSFIIGALPLVYSSPVPEEPATVIAAKTLTRTEPVVCLGSQFPSYVTNLRDVDNMFIWAWRNGDWRQVVFQIDEANGTFVRKDTGTAIGVHKNFYIPDNGWIDNDDEICFMANETGDRVNAPIWAPGANTSIQRYEITVTDPLDTTKKGWAYLFYHDTPPAWTTADYVGWTESTNTVNAYGYSIDYFDNDAKQICFNDMRVKPTIGGDNTDLVDRDKKVVNVAVTIEAVRSEYSTSTRGIETYYSGLDNDQQYYHDYGIRDGPVRVIKHLRWGFGSANLFDLTDKMGFRAHMEFKYYSNMYVEDEYILSQTTGAKSQYYYRAVDHAAAAGPMTYYNSAAGAGTINGNTADDSVPTTLMLWDQVSSAHGSYFTRYKPCTFSGEATNPITKTTRWIDNSAATDTDGSRTGAEAGRYGEHGLYMDNPNAIYYWGTGRSNYYVYFLPANSPNVGASYYSINTNPVVTNNPSPLLQTWVADHYPPVTVIGTVLVAGVSSYTVPLSSAGSVQITATVRDVETGNSNIASAVWTDGFANFPGTAMTAVDGSFNSPNEPVRATINLATWPAGVHQIYVYGTDQYLNKNETSTQYATITITDDKAPSTNTGTVLVDGATTHTTLFSEAAPVHLTATVDDTNRGFSDIISAVWTPQFASFPGTAMTAVDGTFDTHLEPVEATLDLPSWNAGVYNIHVYGTDATPLQNTTSTQKATVTIIDDVAPLTSGVLLNGQAVLSMSITDDPLIDLTALVDDAGRGGTLIAGANYTIGAQNWASSVPLTPVNALDSATEAFANVIDVTGWYPGTYIFYVYGRDSVPNCDIANAPYAILIIQNNFAPAVENVLVNGVPEISVPFSARGTAILTATLDDTGRGDNIIAGANYTVGMANWPTGMPMVPMNALDTPVEDFTATVDISAWARGIYDLYAYGWDESNDCNATSQLFARIIITDDAAPTVDTVRINGLEVFETTDTGIGAITLTAWVDDTLTGNTVIGGANYTVGPAKWPATAMTPQNALDTAREGFTANLDISAWPAGVYYLYAYGWDATLNRNPVPGEYATLIIHDVTAPAISNVRINGTSIFTVDYANATSVQLTALLDDTGRGDSEIGGANYTLGFRDWASAVPMSTYNDEALADVGVSGVVSSDDYTAPNNFRNTLQLPDDGRYEHITEVPTPTPYMYDLKTYGAGNKQGYAKNVNTGTFTATNWDMSGTGGFTELTATQYTQVNTEDASVWQYDNANAKYWRYHFHINQQETSVSSIDVYWHADRVERAAQCPMTLHVWNHVTLTWLQIDSDTTTADNQALTLSGSVTANLADYIDGSGYVYIGIYSVDAGLTARYVETDYLSITVNDLVPGIDHRWRFDMGSNPTFYVEASNPVGSDSTFKFQWSSNGGTAWNDFTTNIQFAAGEVNVLKSSTIAIATYYDSFLVRAVTLNPGANADTFSIDRIWATGQFNNNPEPVYKVIDISNWQPGEYQLYVYGWDKSPRYNTTSRAYATLLITDNLPPEILNFLVDGVKHRTVNLSGGFVTLTGTVDDSRTGNADIAWGGYAHEDANMTIGEYMTNDTALDSPVETFTMVANISGWHAVNNTFIMYGGDAVGMNNETSTENVTINVVDDVAPATADWSIRLNGASQIWVDPLITTSVTITATIDDSLHGWSNVTAAQWTNGSGNFAGNWMLPVGGSWDNYTKQVTGTIDITGWVPATYYIYVYGADSCGNAQTSVLTYAILYLDNNGPAIEGPWAGPALATATQNPYVFVTATSFVIKAYGDDRLRGRSVVTGAEYFVDVIGVNGTGTAMKNVGFRFDSPYEGAYSTIACSAWLPGTFHTYYIHFQDAMGAWGDWGSVLVMRQGPTFNIPIHVGWNLISLPLVTASSNIVDILSGISWDRAFVYDPLDLNPWQSYTIGSPAECNEFTAVDITVGIWVHALADGTLAISGGLAGTTQITLDAGWNLVGYPTLTAGVSALTALAGTGADMIAVYDAASPFIRDVTDLSTVAMAPGNGYWVHVPADTIWTINW